MARKKRSPASSSARAARALSPAAPAARALPPAWTALAAPLLIVAAGMAAYSNSFQCPFILDDVFHIVESRAIRQPLESWRDLLGKQRPVVAWTLAGNYALGGLEVWHYHAFNVAVHILAALTLYGLVRRTLLLPPFHRRFGNAAPWLALAVALVWEVHPLQTQSVTYIIQRGESLMGLFYLLTLYGVLRGATAVSGQRAWYAAAVACCALGMGCKEVMVTAPLVALLYDRVFLAPSWRQLFRQRWGLYAGLAATWGLLAVSLQVVAGADSAGPRVSAGFGFQRFTPVQYALSQPGVILHYLRLSVWPHPLCLDHDWPLARTSDAIVLPTLVIGALLLATLWALWRRPALGFVGAWFLVILAPTSSIMPIADLAVEHRMYLSLAAVVVLVVLAGHAGFGVLVDHHSRGWRLSRCLAAGLLVALVVSLGWRTVQRNADYQSVVGIWRDVVEQRPENPRGHGNLGAALEKEGRDAEAEQHYRTVLRLRPNNAEANARLGTVLARRGEFAEAVGPLRKGLELRPGLRLHETYADLALALINLGQVEEAVAHGSTALELRPDWPQAHTVLGYALFQQGKLEEAAARFGEAARLQPGSADAHSNLGRALMFVGKLDEAAAECSEALRLQPDHLFAHTNLGMILVKQGKLDEAANRFSRALELRPDDLAAQEGLADILRAKARSKAED